MPGSKCRRRRPSGSSQRKLANPPPCASSMRGVRARQRSSPARSEKSNGRRRYAGSGCGSRRPRGASRSSRPSSASCSTMYANAVFVSDAPYSTVSGVSGLPTAALRMPNTRTFATWPFSIVASASPCTCSRRMTRCTSGSDSDCSGRSGGAHPAASTAATPSAIHDPPRIPVSRRRAAPHRAAPQRAMMPWPCHSVMSHR